MDEKTSLQQHQPQCQSTLYPLLWAFLLVQRFTIILTIGKKVLQPKLAFQMRLRLLHLYAFCLSRGLP